MVFRYASQPMLIALALSVPALAILYVQIANSDPQPWYWMGFILFGWLTFLALRRLVDTSPVVRIGAPGISDARVQGGVVPWDKIDAVVFLPEQESLLVLVTDAELFARSSLRSRFFRLPGHPVLEAPGSPSITIRFKGLVPGAGEAWDYIRNNFPDKVLPPSPDSWRLSAVRPGRR